MSMPSLIPSASQKKADESISGASKKPTNPLSYPKSKAPFSAELFKNPTSEYRGCPFWAWNTKLDQAQLLRQIDYFEAMGMGGFHIHVRVGLDTEYMGEEFMDMVRTCVEYAESKNMLACLYDEDRWPSGTSGGKVIQDHPEFKQKHIRFTPHEYHSGFTIDEECLTSPEIDYRSESESDNLLGVYDIELDENGCLKSSRMLKKGETGKNLWYAYLESSGNSPWFNGQTYVDSLSKSAIAHFIETTHEVYKANVGDKFGSVVPCIFTDEPEFSMLIQLSSPNGKDDAYIPWTYDLPETFKKQYSTDIVKSLPELFWDLPNGEASVMRYRWHDHNCERFVSAFMDQIGQWCKENELMLNGHMMEEPYLWSQTHSIGEAMRCYRNMEMPGMDLLVDGIEYNTAKQVSSVSRQNGTKGAMSEIYGVTHWFFTFEGHKGCGDWQAALGITFRVHHLAWVSMAGEGKRDYPASIGYQSPWYKEYDYVEEYFARVGVVLTRGHAVTKVGVIHPIESYWLSWGPNRMGDERDRREQAFADLTWWLLHGLIDFDFISESLLPNQVGRKINGKKLAVGKCEYDVIILPNLRTIRSTTLKILNNFTKAGGEVILAGSTPSLVDGQTPRSVPVIEHSKTVFWSQQSILLALDGYRDIRVTYNSGSATDKLLYQMRQDEEERFVFICNTDRNSPIETTLHLEGYWNVVLMDTLTGEEHGLKSKSGNGWTDFPYRFEGCASLLLHLSPKSEFAMACLSPQIKCNEEIEALNEMMLDGVELSEPNVLLLDYAKFKLDDGEWSDLAEVLRIDNIIRSQLHLPYKGGVWKQPWAIPKSERSPVTVVTLQITFESSFTITDTTMLALEDAETKSIFINNTFVPSTTDRAHLGWWVDEAIKTVPIPGNLIKQGTNTIALTFPFGLLTNLERVYLLGKFAVDLQDHRTALLQPLKLKELKWGDITTQGLPFYAGNVTYKCTFSVPSGIATASSEIPLVLSVPQFASPVLTVTDLKTYQTLGRIAFQPHTLAIGNFKAGYHKIGITAFGDRFNSFGHLHLTGGAATWCGPDMWRTSGDVWTDNYNLRPIGVLESPKILSGNKEAIGDTNDDELADVMEVKDVQGGWVAVSWTKSQMNVEKEVD